MSDFKSLSFALSGSFILQGIEGEPAFTGEPPNEPSKIEKSKICDYLMNSCYEDFHILSLMKDIERDHSITKLPLYLDIFHITLSPKTKPGTIKERMQLLKNVLSNLFTIEQIETCSSGRMKVALSFLTEWQKFVLDAALYHFHKMMTTEYYESENIKKQFVQATLKMFLPAELNPPPHARVVSPLTLVDGDISLQNSKNVYITVYSPTNIMIESQDLLISKNLCFTRSDTVNDTQIKLTSSDRSDTKFTFAFKDLSTQIWDNILWPLPNENRSAARAVVESCLAYGAAKNQCPAAATCMARVVATMDHRFLFAIYSVLSSAIDSLPNVFNCLLDFYAFHSKHLQLLKFLCYYELRRTDNTNEIFRQNNNFIRSINLFIRRVSTNYINTTVKDLYLICAKHPNWKLEKPTEKDATVLAELMVKFWTRMIETISTVPPSIRNLMRYLRILSESMFRNKTLNHRALFGVFFLRFVLVVLVSPMDFGINMEEDPAGYAKVTQFTKILAYSGQLQLISGNEDNPKKLLNSALEGANELVIKFYDKLCEQVEADDVPVSQDSLAKSTTEFCKFVQQNKEKILSYDQENHYASIFVDEFIYEYLTNLK